MSNNVPFVPCACGLHKKHPKARECRWCAAKRRSHKASHVNQACVDYAAAAVADFAEGVAFAVGLGQTDWDEDMLLEECKRLKLRQEHDAAMITILQNKLKRQHP